jgi:hypothetical protein
MKKIYYILAFLLMFQQTFAIYTTPGTGKNWNLDSLVANSSGHITLSGGIYFVNDTLIVSETDTLKILQNATIEMGNLSFIRIYGTFLINPPDSVKITAADTSLKHIGIRLDSLADASVFKRLIFEYGNSIYAFNCNMLIDSCIIRYNTNYASGMQSGAIGLYKSNVIISNCKIYRNRRAAVVSGSNIASSPRIIGNLIYENDVENGNYPQINLGAGSTDTVVIRNNTIIGLSPMSGGMSFYPIGSIPSLIIENNIIKKNRYGIVLYNVNINAYINNNVIDSNNIQGLPLLGGSGINIYGDSTIKAVFTRNTIRWNLWGVTVQTSSTTKPPKPNFGNLSNTDTSDNGYNKIYYNSHNDSTFDFYYNVTTTDTMKAENNYWGTTNLDSIEAHIWHNPDISTLGFVDYMPIWTVITSTGKNTLEIPSEYKLFNAYPNPFNPSTNIKYQISLQGGSSTNNRFVTLKVYDVLGKEIATLVNEQQKPGVYEVQFSMNNSSISSGVYFYRLTVGSFSDTKKLVLMK